MISSSRNRGLRYAMPAMYRKGDAIEPRRIYVTDPESALELADEDVLAIVCRDKDDGSSLGARNVPGDLIVLEAPEGAIVDVTNCLLDLFHQEDTWRGSLLTLCFDQNRTVKDFLETA